MFRRLAPQIVRHSSGFVVQVVSRERVELVEAGGEVVRVAIEFGPVSALYRDSINKADSNGRAVLLSGEEKEALLAQIKGGLEAMGGSYEVV